MPQSGQTTTWSSAARTARAGRSRLASVTTTFFVDSGLEYSTTYSYYVVAVAAGGAMAQSSVVTAETGRQPDVLSDGVTSLRLSRGVLFSGPIASFSDTNPTTSASQFVAKIKWGDGRSSVATVTGAAGSFVIDASHKYARNGRYTIRVTVTMAGPTSAESNGTGNVVVTNPPRHHAHARVIHRLAKRPAKPAKKRQK